MSTEFQPYLDQVTRHVERDPGLVFEIQSELRTHLQCAADEFEAQGFSRQEAVEESLRAFGDPGQLALEFKSTYAGRPVIGQGLRFLALWLAFPLAFLAVHLAWTGIREAWWHESSGWHGAQALITQIASAPTPDPAFLPGDPDPYRLAAWRFLATQGAPGPDPAPSDRKAFHSDFNAVLQTSQSRSRGVDYAFQAGLRCRQHLPFIPISGPSYTFQPWTMNNLYDSHYWDLRRKAKPAQPVGKSEVSAWAIALEWALTHIHLTEALAQPTLSDTTGDYWQARLSSQAPTSFKDLISRYAARFASQGICLTTTSADQLIRLAEEKALVGDVESAKAILDITDRLIAKHMSELPPTKAILPLAVFRLIYLPDCRQGILGDKAGPGPGPLALAALSQELAPFQANVYLPGVNPRNAPIPPGAWARLSGWAALTNNLLVIALACLVLLLAAAWLVWAFAAVLGAGIISPSQAPGLLPRPVTRIALPAALLIWGTLAVFFAGLFANPSMRLDAQVWMAYPGLILLSGVVYMALCIAISHRQVSLRSASPAPSPGDISAGRFFIAYTICFNILLLALCMNPRNISHVPVILLVPAAGLAFLAGYLARRKFHLLTDHHKARVLIQTRSLRLSLGLAVACLSLGCLGLYIVECAAAWAAWQSTALSQPLSDEFKREVLGH